MGVCGQCKDVTESTKTNCTAERSSDYSPQHGYGSLQLSCNYSSPAGFTTSAQASSVVDGVNSFYQTLLNITANQAYWYHYTVMGGTIPNSTILDFAVFRITAVSNSIDIDNLPLAEVPECSLDLCAQTFQGVHVNNTATVNAVPIRTWPFQLFNKTTIDDAGSLDPWDDDSRLYLPFKISGDDLDEYSIRNSTFTINMADFASLQTYLYNLVSVSRQSDTGLYANTGPNPQAADASYPFSQSKNISNLVQNLATSLSNAMRVSSLTGNFSTHFSDVPTSVNGSVYAPEVFVNVSWAWLALPGLVVLSGTAILFATILLTKRRASKLWKSSNLALVIHGLEAKVPNSVVVEPSVDSWRLRERAEKLQVQVKPTREGAIRIVQV